MKVDHLSDVELALRPHRVSGPVMAAFVDAAAIQPAAAMAYRPGSPGAKDELKRLRDAGVLKRTAAGEWFDLRAHYAAEQAKTVRQAIYGLVIALAIALVAVLFYQR